MLEITPCFLRAICVYKKISIAELYNLLGLNEFFTLSYFYRLTSEDKPITDNLKKILNNKINESITTKELIKVIKLHEHLK